jgi:hypothetical protein
VRLFSIPRARLDAPRVDRRWWLVWHDLRTPESMCAPRLVLFLVLCTLPSAVAAQPWAEAYKAGDYAKAADLLHPLVIQGVVQPDSGDPEPPRHLATMYAQGLGVPQDLIAACSLAQVVSMATSFSAPRYAQNIEAYDAAVKEADSFSNKHCDGLSTWDRMAASISMGCFAFGMPEEMLTLGTEAVSVGRGGIWLRDALPERPEQLMNCLMRIARVRAVTVEPPSEAAPGVAARHFVELLGWAGGQRPGGEAARYALQWQLYELRGKKIEFAAHDVLDETLEWPPPGPPGKFDERFRMEMIRSGHVRWRLEGTPPKRGWIRLPEEESR